MTPTTAADRMLVTRSMTSSFDWMLTRDITGGRNHRRVNAEPPGPRVSDPAVIDAPLRPENQGGIGRPFERKHLPGEDYLVKLGVWSHSEKIAAILGPKI